MKRVYSVIIISLIILVSLQLVNAQYPNIDTFMQQVGDASASIFGPIFGHDTADEFLFAKILLFLLIFTIVFTVLKNITIFEYNKPVQSVVSIIFSLFSVRYIKPNEIINAILLPYGAFGASITIFLPLLIYFYFVHSSVNNSFARRAAWFIYGSIFFILWVMRPYSDLGTTNWIYFLGLGFIILNLLFDKTIQSYFGLADIERWNQRTNDSRIAFLQSEYDRIRDTESPAAHRRKLQIMRELRRCQADRW